MGVQRDEVEEAGRKAVLELDLPLSTPPLGSSVSNSLAKVDGSKTSDDLRGQHVDEALSTLRPRRLITLAPSLDSSRPLETLVAAYCPLPEEGGGTVACGDVVVLRGGTEALQEGLNTLQPLLPDDLHSWVWWNGPLDVIGEALDRSSQAHFGFCSWESLLLPEPSRHQARKRPGRE